MLLLHSGLLCALGATLVAAPESVESAVAGHGPVAGCLRMRGGITAEPRKRFSISSMPRAKSVAQTHPAWTARCGGKTLDVNGTVICVRRRRLAREARTDSGAGSASTTTSSAWARPTPCRPRWTSSSRSCASTEASRI